jgi:hypothetical protein
VLLVLRRGRGWVEAARRRRAGGAARARGGSVRASRRGGELICGRLSFLAGKTWGPDAPRARGRARGGVHPEVGDR